MAGPNWPTQVGFRPTDCTYLRHFFYIERDILELTTRTTERGDLLTVRELARLQGFPDDFVFYGSKERQYEQVLEAFPPPVAKAIAG